MSAPTLAEFLLARIAEDEADADKVAAALIALPRAAHQDFIRAECEAKRRIVELHRNPPGTDWCLCCVEPDGTDTPFPCPTVRILTSVYSDHPDYDEAWRA